jgi:hypothetical protein
MPEYRTVQKRVEKIVETGVNRKRVDKEWVDIKFKDLKIGDNFRMFEPSGEPVDGGRVDKVISGPYLNEDGIWTVTTDG